MIESIKYLREELEKIDSMLVIGDEEPETFIPKLLSLDENTHNIIVY